MSIRPAFGETKQRAKEIAFNNVSSRLSGLEFLGQLRQNSVAAHQERRSVFKVLFPTSKPALKISTTLPIASMVFFSILPVSKPKAILSPHKSR
jgi:hypothetical protein